MGPLLSFNLDYRVLTVVFMAYVFPLTFLNLPFE